MKSLIGFLIVFSGLTTLSTSAEQWQLKLNPDATIVTFKLDATLHTVEGTFALDSGEVRFEPKSRQASGMIIVDAQSGQTGVGRRDMKMHSSVLESELYPVVTFRPERVLGEIRITGESSVLVRGTLTMHGEEHTVTMPVTTEIEGTRVLVNASLAIPYVQWGLADPSRWYVRVAKEVFLLIEAEGTIAEITP